MRAAQHTPPHVPPVTPQSVEPSESASPSEISCHVLMLSVGVSWNLLTAAGAEQLIGSGIYYGAARR